MVLFIKYYIGSTHEVSTASHRSISKLSACSVERRVFSVRWCSALMSFKLTVYLNCQHQYLRVLPLSTSHRLVCFLSCLPSEAKVLYLVLVSQIGFLSQYFIVPSDIARPLIYCKRLATFFDFSCLINSYGFTGSDYKLVKNETLLYGRYLAFYVRNPRLFQCIELTELNVHYRNYTMATAINREKSRERTQSLSARLGNSLIGLTHTTWLLSPYLIFFRLYSLVYL